MNSFTKIRLLITYTLTAVLSLLSVWGNAQTVTPTQTDNITNDNGNNQVDPGETIRYKLDISNSGSDANGVQLNAVPDAKTTLLPGSFRSSPLAMPDSYACTGNVGITVPAGSGVLINDFDDDIPGLTITAAAGATTEGGAFAIASDGSFSYQPPAGFIGTDEFTYTLEDGNEVPDCPPTDEGTVIITVSNLIWFVDNTGGGSGGDGRLNTPFKTLADFNANSTPVGDVTYIEHTGTDYTGGIVLQNNERLFGEGHSGGANLADVLGFSLAPFSNMLPAINGSRPLVTNTGTGDGIQLASNNTVRGLNVGNCAGFGIDDNGAVGSLTISEVDISNSTGGGFRTDNGGTLAVTMDGVSSTGGVNGVDLDNCSGTFTVSGSTAVTNSTGTAVNISNNGATVDLGTLNITNTTSNQTGLFASGGTINSTSGAINTGSGRAVDMDNVALGMTLTSVSCNGGSNPCIDLGTTSGPFSVVGMGTTPQSGGTIQNVINDAVNLSTTSGPVTLKNMLIQDIGDMSTGNPGHRGIEGQNVNGGLVLDMVTFDNLTDNAIFGEGPGGIGSTFWNGLSITNCAFNDGNRFHLPGQADAGATQDAMVSIEGISGTVVVTNSDFQRAPGFLNFFTASSGNINMTVQGNNFVNAYKDLNGQPSRGGTGIRVNTNGTITAAIRIGPTDENNVSQGNTFSNGGSDAAISVSGFTAGDASNVDLVISQNNTTVTDHLSPAGTSNNNFDFPNGGIRVESRGSGTFEAIVSNNTFVETQNAGGLSTGSLLLDVSGPNTEIIVRGNTFDKVWDKPIFIRSDDLDGNGANGKLLVQNNIYIEGLIGDTNPGNGITDDLEALGFGSSISPFLPFSVSVRNGSTLNLTIENEDLPEHDTGTNPGFPASLDTRIAGSGGILNLFLKDNKSPDGFYFRDDAGASGTFNLFKDVSNSATIAAVLQDNGNSGGNNNDNTTPPQIFNPFGTINLLAGTPMLPVVNAQ